MKRSLNLAISEDVAQQLAWLAERDFRRPREEAEFLLAQAIRRVVVARGSSRGAARGEMLNPRFESCHD